MNWVSRFLERRPRLVANIHPIEREGVGGRRMLSILNESKLKRVLARMLDEERFLSPHGGRRPVFGDAKKFQNDPNWRDYLLFNSHQTGWTGLVARRSTNSTSCARNMS